MQFSNTEQTVFSEQDERRIEQIKRLLGDDMVLLMEESDVVEIILNADGQLWVERFGKRMEAFSSMTAPRAEMLINAIAEYYDESITAESPSFQGTLPLNGARIQALIPPVVSAPIINIRLKARAVFTLSDYVAKGYMSETQKTVIEEAVKTRKNILVVGGTGSGKTTLTNGLVDSIVQHAPSDRLIIIEDTPEIQCHAKSHASLITCPKMDMQALLRVTLRLRPDRILVGEVRGAEALTLLKSWNTGHPGGVCTLHANSAMEGLSKLEQYIAEASVLPQPRLIAEAVDLVIFIAKVSNKPNVEQIISVTGFDGINYVYKEH